MDAYSFSQAVATTCLFLAGKVEETPKKLKEVIEAAHHVRKESKPLTETEMEKEREKILQHEFILLQTIAFDLTIDHPYKYLLTYVKSIEGKKELAQVAWNFTNDSLRTTLCLQFKPQLVAAAALYLASTYLKYQPVDPPWWDVLHFEKKQLEEIGNQILDLYESIPNVDAIKSITQQKGEEGKQEAPKIEEPKKAEIKTEKTDNSGVSPQPVPAADMTKPPSHSTLVDTKVKAQATPNSSQNLPPKRENSPSPRNRGRSRTPPRSPSSRRSPSRSRSRSPSRSRSRSPRRHSRSPSRRSRSNSPRRSPRRSPYHRRNDRNDRSDRNDGRSRDSQRRDSGSYRNSPRRSNSSSYNKRY